MRQAILGALIILLCLGVGYVLRQVSGLFIPVPVWGLLALLLFFFTLGRVPSGVRMIGEFLIRHMALFFIPPVLGLMAMGELLRRDGLGLLVAIALSTTLGLLVTAKIFDWTKARDE